MTQSRYLIAGPILLDCRDERLWHDGTLVRLGGKALALLRTLMERPRVLVTKDDLFDSVWPGVAVSESVLTTAIKEVRQALGDDARSPHVVETVHGRGYRFLLDVEACDSPPATAEPEPPKRGPINRPWIAAALVVLIAVAAATIYLVPSRQSSTGGAAPEAAQTAHPKSIAVLPFDDLSPAGDQQWFAAGLTEEILNSLARTPDLHVAARTSTSALGAGDVRDFGRRLNVAHILEGSVRRDSNRVRVTAQLIRASDGFHLWSENFDRPASDVVSIQEDIAVSIAHALKTVMRPESLQAMVRLGTRSVEAYEAYLRGLAYEQSALVSGADEQAQLASQAYERARTIDPGFAAAQWEAAQAWFGNSTRVGANSTERRGSENRRLTEFLTRVDAAIASSRGQPENYRYRSARALMNLRFREALALMQAYLRERPRDIAAWEEIVDLAGYAENRPLMARAAERIHTLSIESGTPLSRAITASVLSLDIPNAVARARRQLVRSPDEAMIQYQAHRALLWGGHTAEARAILERLARSSMPKDSILLAELRQACAEGGRGAQEIAERLERLPEASLSSRWQAAMIVGDRRRATELLMQLHRPERLTTLMQYLVYPTFDVRPFPLLQARLEAEGIGRPPAKELPFACRAGALRAA